MSKDTIYRQDAIDAMSESLKRVFPEHRQIAEKCLNVLPSAQSEIIRCNACRHWHQTVGKMEGFGLGDCDYLEKKLVTCNGYCYWAKRRTDENQNS